MAGFWLEPIKFGLLLTIPAASVFIFRQPEVLTYVISKTRYVVYDKEVGRQELQDLAEMIREQKK